jgi:cysteine-rich repeat protein
LAYPLRNPSSRFEGARHGSDCDADEGCLLETTLDCCGNGLVEAGEACDDGNDQDGDGCSVGCVDENPAVTLGPNVQITAELAHATMARLDDHHVAVAYAPTPDPTVDPEHYRIAIYKRQGKDITWKGDWLFEQGVPAPGPNGTGGAFALFGSLGPNHLIAVLWTTGGGSVFNTYKWDGADSLVLLSSTAIADGKGFFGGHPVDDTRFIWRFRYDNSGEPVTYQVIERLGDTFSYGPEMIRPGRESFPGLSDDIAQSEPVLRRDGPTTFREIRSGYVWAPGYLASYTLEVDGNELSWGAPVVHANSGMKTMEPLVAADGLGGGAIAYVTYDEAQYQWAHFTAGSFALEYEGPLIDGPTFYGQGALDTTDAHVGGAYFLRERMGNLFKIYAMPNGTWDAISIDNDRPYHACQMAPHTVRVGTLALFLRCSGTTETAYLRTVDLYPGCGDGDTAEGEGCDDGNNDGGDGCSSVCTVE